MKKIYAIIIATIMALSAYAADSATNVYKGKLVISMMGSELTAPGGDDATISITPKGDGKCDFLLPDFTLSTMGNFGDINVENVDMTTADGKTNYKGAVKGLELLDGQLVADVDLAGVEDADGNIDMDINVSWQGIPVICKFTGKKEQAGMSGIQASDGAEAVYYSLTGNRIPRSALVPGIYIRRQGGKTAKIVIK